MTLLIWPWPCYDSYQGTEIPGQQMNWQRCYCHTCPHYKIICSVSITTSRSTRVFCWCKALDCQDRACHVFTRKFSYGEMVLLNVKLWDWALRYFSFRFSLTLWKYVLLLSSLSARVGYNCFFSPPSGKGEIEAIVVPVCLAFLLIVLLGVLFCFNKRDL